MAPLEIDHVVDVRDHTGRPVRLIVPTSPHRSHDIAKALDIYDKIDSAHRFQGRLHDLILHHRDPEDLRWRFGPTEDAVQRKRIRSHGTQHIMILIVDRYRH